MPREHEIDGATVRRLRPRIKPEIVDMAVAVSKLHGPGAQRAVGRLFDTDRNIARVVVGLATELRAARLISPFVDSVELTDECLDRRGFDLVVDLAVGSRVYVQVKASAKFRRIESTGHASVLILPPNETDADARRRISKLVDRLVDDAIGRIECAST